jgi:PAS domain S-box-containing protein
MNESHAPEIFTIILVEDNSADALLIQERLSERSDEFPFHLLHVRTLQEASEIVRISDVHAILLDLNLPGSNGLETLSRMLSVGPSIPIVVLTGTEDESLAREAIRLGAQDYIPKSHMNAVLFARVLSYAMERERHEQIRLDSERKFRLFVEGATGLAFILLDLHGNITHWNTGAQRLFGYPEEATLNNHFSFLFTAEDQKNGRPETELRQARNNEKGDDDNWLVRADGSAFWASGGVTAVRDAKENLIGFAKVVRDITSQKKVNEKLAQLNRTLEERVHARTQELVRNRERLRAMASELTLAEQRERRRLASDLHDYLAQLLVVCRLKLSQSQSSEDTEDMRKMMQEADGLLDQSLTYTRTLVSQLSPSCLYEFGLQSALVWLGSEMQKQGLQVTLHENNLNLNLPEDQAVLIYQSVRELLYNVLKHSGVKEATIRLAIEPDNHLHIQVEDHGRGFIETHFEREEGFSTKFGLFSIRERIQALGGKLIVTSIPDEGTRALLRIPLKRETEKATRQVEKAKSAPPSQPFHGAPSSTDKIRILLVDDHKMVREGFYHILNAQSDMEVVGEAENGQQAIALCHSLGPDVVVMDLHMPNMDGLEATKRIKQDCPGTVVIGLSIHDNLEVMRWFMDAGADEFVAKSGSTKSLLYAIRQFGQSSKSH